MTSTFRLPPVIDERQNWFRLELPPSDVAATVARSAIRRVVSFADDDRESSFLVALTEVVINAVDEHRRSAPDERVEVEVRLGGEPSVHVIDRGSGLDADLADADGRAAVPAPSDQTGRGLSLARAFVPDLRFEVDGSGTTAILPLAGFATAR